MIRRTVTFLLTADGRVSPSVPQYGGVKGEHRVTNLSFTLSGTDAYETGDLVRLSFCTGDGTVVSSDLLEPIVDATTNHAAVNYALPQTLTMAGGQLCVRLILSRTDENGNEIEVLRSGEAVLYFEEAAVENGTPFWTGVSEMLERTVTAKEAAVGAQGYAVDAYRDAFEERKKAEQAKEEAKLQALKAEQFSLQAYDASQEAADAKEEILAAHNENAQQLVVHQAMLGAINEAVHANATAIETNKTSCDTRLAQTNAVLQQLMSDKLNSKGFSPNRYLGTDDKGNVVVKLAPSGDGSGIDLPFTGIGDGLYIDRETGELQVDESYVSNYLSGLTVLRYQGLVMTEEELYTKQVSMGAVFRVIANNVCYVRVDTGWAPLCVGVNTDEVENIVTAAIQAYDSEAMALLGEDGDGE